MDPDKYQQAWHAQTAQPKVIVHADLLLEEVQRHQGNFQATIFWRDFREVGIAVLLLPIWFYLGIRTSSPWTWYLTVPALLWIIGFMLVDRFRHRPKPSEPGEPLIDCVKVSLAQVEHQIWLLRNVFWWYLLPFCISILAFFFHTAWLTSSAWWEFIASTLALSSLLAVVYGLVYFINQRSVRKQLQPRREELLALLMSLGDESSGESSGESTGEPETYAIVPASLSPFAEERFLTPSGAGIRNAVAMVVLVAALILVVVLVDMASRISDSQYAGTAQSSGVNGDALALQVTELREQKSLVGLAAMVMVDGKVGAVAAQGERIIGSGVSVEIDDRWHVGGITKSITATMIGRLIEADQMHWSDTVGSVFSEPNVHADWKSVTLRQLLTDIAGAPANFPRELWSHRPKPGIESTRARREAVMDVVSQPLPRPAGQMYSYSNVGMTIAGAMAEEVTGFSWEDLVKQEVFEPLELTGSGFGPPRSPSDTLPQPRGHRARLAGKFAMDDDADNTPIMGPSGTVHMTLRDLCTYATEHMQGDLGKGKLLSKETYERLHAAEQNQYACGWVVRYPDSRIPYKNYWHNGSNTMWYALMVFVPEKNMVVAVASNDGDSEKAEAAAWRVVEASVSRDPLLGQSAFAKKSPFAAIRWQGNQPEVMLDDDWFTLVSIGDVSVAQIVDFSKQKYDQLWQKRFEEDLVEVLTRMGHPPADSVTLIVESLFTGEQIKMENVVMSEENRKAIRAAARSRQDSSQ
ncbi:beta-lactamase family protein [Rubripirellula amarantea]|nr:beta-lactamase family protein [Rubripirellula amarantea]